MFSSSSELQARRKTLSILQDEAKRVLEAAREFSETFPAILGNDQQALNRCAEAIMKAEDDVENLRRVLTRELAELGPMVINREDVLRAAYDIEEIASYISSAAFRLAGFKLTDFKKTSLLKDLGSVIDLAVEMVHRLNEVVRALTINPSLAIELTNSIQKIERQVDDQYRSLSLKLLSELESFKEVLVLKDIIERVENMADQCLKAADSITIIALSL
jgi:predicted phosphate transport protein (TIGR00153 family)